MSVNKENKRKCFRCGRSPVADPDISLFRFPKPGKTNSLRCELWSKYCFPHREWSSPEFQQKLYSEHRMLCSRHFKKTSFRDYPLSTMKLHRFAVPDGTKSDEMETNERDTEPGPSIPITKKTTQDQETKIVDVEQKVDPGAQNSSPTRYVVHVSASKYPKGTRTYSKHRVEDAPQEPTSEVSFSEDTNVVDFESDVNITKDPATMESHPEVPEVVGPFTWQKPSEVIDSGDEDDAQYIGTEIMTDDILLYNDGKSSAIDTCEIINQDVSTNEGSESNQREKQLQYHKEYKCNHCSGPIEGFRYRCVQCADYDLCTACEARGAHERHYVLRIPGPRPYAEIEAVLQKIKAELLSGSHSVLLEDTQMLDSVKEEIKDEEQDPLVVDPTNPIDPLFGDADDTHSEVMTHVSQSDKEFEQQGSLEDNDFKRTKRKRSDSASEHDYSIRRVNLQTYSSKKPNSSNKKLILDNRTQKPDENQTQKPEKATQKSHELDDRMFLITKPGKKYVAIKNIEIVQKTVNIVPNKLSDPKILVTRLKPLNATGALQSPTGSQLPGIPLKQISTATVHPSNKPSTPNILKKTPIVIKKLSD